MHCGKLDDKIEIVRLCFSLMCRLVSDDSRALIALMDNDVALLCIGGGAYRTKYSAAFVRSVSGIHVNVQRAEAKRAMVSRRISEREHLFTAILANKSIIVF